MFPASVIFKWSWYLSFKLTLSLVLRNTSKKKVSTLLFQLYLANPVILPNSATPKPQVPTHVAYSWAKEPKNLQMSQRVQTIIRP